jgi:hypothetical protein
VHAEAWFIGMLLTRYVTCNVRQQARQQAAATLARPSSSSLAVSCPASGAAAMDRVSVHADEGACSMC